MSVLSLGYLALASPDVDAWATTAERLLGMTPTDPTGHTGRWRIDQHAQRLSVEPASEPRMIALGFEVADARALSACRAAVEAAGIETHGGGVPDLDRRLVSGLARFVDPAGVPIELFHGPVHRHAPLDRRLVSGFVTGAQGMGHVVLRSPDAERAVEFHIGVLGFREHNTMALPDGMMWFLSPNERHHSLAYLEGGDRTAIAHVMVEAAELDDVGRALDRVARHDKQMVRLGLGRHSNDGVVSFYLDGPDGVGIELGWGGSAVTSESTYRITAPSLWGHWRRGEGPRPEPI